MNNWTWWWWWWCSCSLFMLTTTSTNSLTECMWPVASTKSSGLSCCSISHIPEMLVIVVINMLKQFMINDIFNITTTSSSPWTRPGLGAVPHALQDGGRHNRQNIISIVTIGNWWPLSFFLPRKEPLQSLMLSKVVILTFVIVIVGIVTRVILLPLSQFVLLFFYTFNIVLGMPPVPHAV